MTTFSQMVDELVLEHSRPDLRAAIASYVNLTLRELHSSPNQGGGSIFYPANLKEAQITTDVANGFAWEIPRPQNFQGIAAVRFDYFGDSDSAYAKERHPSAMGSGVPTRKQYYRSGNTFAFTNYGGIGQTISLAWYETPPRLAYFAVADRPAQWDEVTQAYTYHADYIGSAILQEQAREMTTNWILERWDDLVRAGTRPKTYVRAGDVERSRLFFSTYTGMRADMMVAETFPAG